MNIIETIAKELAVKTQQISAAITLLDDGATVPFISRYRKEVTGGLSDTQLRDLSERLIYLRELTERQQVILKSIQEQQKLTPELEKQILETDNKSTLEDLYLPYKPKRRTKAQIAREAGLEPLASQLLQNPAVTPTLLAESFLNPDHQIHTAGDALSGARYILMEQFAENAELIGTLREFLWEQGIVTSQVVAGKEEPGAKFGDYFTYQEPIKNIPSHRSLALLRGQREDILTINLTLTDDQKLFCLQKIAQQYQIQQLQRPADSWLAETIDMTFRVKFLLKLELELMNRLRELAEDEAIRVFANNLKHLLMAAPAGSRTTLGLDPGLRTGVKAIVVDQTGKLLTHITLFPHAPRHDWDNAITILAALCKEFHVELVSIGNGTASRETDKLIVELKKRHPELTITSLVVSEAGASVYSASAVAAAEFPTLDVSYRGAVSIARRLQDPLAELVKIEPKSIGVGQYQHDVNQVKLSRSLHSVMEDCVNAVGVDVNTASIPLLSCVAGLSVSIAKNIVAFRDEHGAFKNRNALKKVPRLGDKAFEQAAGFLRVVNGDNPLDTSAVHPEAYSIVTAILQQQNKSLKEIMGNTTILKKLNPAAYTNAHFGLPTVTDILRELEKPGRDPRPEFKTATFSDQINTINDLRPDMVLEGVITNVANFGAFVDIGVHQDGLVHISMLANHFVKNPNDVVKVGDIVKVKVLEIDIKRNRIQLSMRLEDKLAATTKPQTNYRQPQKTSSKKIEGTTLGDALLSALKK